MNTMNATPRLLAIALALLLSACKSVPEIVFPQEHSPVFADDIGPVARIGSPELYAPVDTDAPLVAISPGAEAQYQWTLIDRPPESAAVIADAAAPQARLHIDRAGVYRVALRVRIGPQGAWSAPVDGRVVTERHALTRQRFAAMGDFGTGDPDQYRIARVLARFCGERGCDFVLGLGDNIYDSGPTAVSDPQFADKFEKPNAVVPLPFYMVQGNHDNTGARAGDGVFNRRGDIQVAYGRQGGRASLKWQMPARYYGLTMPLDGPPLIELLAYDSTVLTGLPDPAPEFKLSTWAERQGAWLDQHLKRSAAPWRIAFAHHMLVSNGEHGNAGRWDHIDLLGDAEIVKRGSGEHYREFVERKLCGRVDLLIAGHDHSMQLLEPQARCGKTRFVVSGAGAKGTPLKNRHQNPATWQEEGALGFFWFDILGDRLKIAAVVADGETARVATERCYERTGEATVPVDCAAH